MKHLTSFCFLLIASHIITACRQQKSFEEIQKQRIKDGDELVKINVYYESLCPDSKAFITQQLGPVYQKFKKYLEVELRPYGNANATWQAGRDPKKEGGRWGFGCQHGVLECLGNLLHASLIGVPWHPQQSWHEAIVPIIACHMSNLTPGSDSNETSTTIHASFKQCMENQTLAFNVSDTYEMIQKLSGSDEAKRILMEFGSQTPRHEFIPHVVINGESHVKKITYDDLEKTLCTGLLSQVEECKKD